MPFTFSHAAAALPVHHAARRLPLDALVVGTMSPDFEYVLRLAVRGWFAHSPAGLVAFCLPVSFAAVLAWRALVRPALLDLAPPGLADGLRRPHRSSDPVAMLLTALAVLIGAVTHVAWDGLTHRGGWAVDLAPALRSPVPGLGMPWYNLLQHLSTLLGAAVLALAAAAWLRRQPREALRFAPGQRARALRVSAVIAAIAATAAVLNGARGLGSGLEWAVGYAAVSGMAGLAVAGVGYGLMVRFGRRG